MDHMTDAMEMVDLLHHPAFCVKEGIIVKVNTAARQRMIEPDTLVSELIKNGSEEYEEFSDGCLYLTLEVSGMELGFSVIRKYGFDLFRLEQDVENYELQAMALAARELREPLASIMISADHLFPAAGHGDDPRTGEQVARINRGLFQMLRLISNMSDAGRYAAADSVPMEIKNISALLEEIFKKAAALVDQAGLHLNFEGISEAVYGLANEELLERAVLNMISNAIKFTPAGGTIEANLLRRGKKLCLSIQDNGSGIPEELRSSLFSRYTREPGVEDGRYGIGLGFVIVRSAAARHGGAVLVDHPQDRGTRITMTLSLRSGSASQVRSPILKVDYAGERDHGLLELSDVLPAELYDSRKIN